MSRGKHAPAKSGGFPGPARAAHAEARLRVEIEEGSERMRRGDVPWDLVALYAIIIAVVIGPGVWAGYRVGHEVGWW